MKVLTAPYPLFKFNQIPGGTPFYWARYKQLMIKIDSTLYNHTYNFNQTRHEVEICERINAVGIEDGKLFQVPEDTVVSLPNARIYIESETKP